MHKILVSDPLSEKGLKILKNAGFKVIYKPNSIEQELESIIGDIDAWIIRSGTNVTKKLLKKTNVLKVIGRAGVGVDNIDIVEATNLGIIVMNLPDGNTISAAELTMAMIMAISRNVHFAHMDLILGNWNRSSFIGSEINNKVLGVVGLGRIGREVIKRAQSFNMKIIGYDPYVNTEIVNSLSISIVDLDTLIKKSDIITLHIPLTNSTKNLFNSKIFAKMKPSSRIINVARGGVINENDLADALNNGIISGAAVDVFENEPIGKNHPLINANNVLLTPHLGASTVEAKEGVSIGLCNQIVDFLQKDILINPINMPISDISELNKIAPYLKLAQIIGDILEQIIITPVESVCIECFGLVNNSNTIMLRFIMSLLKNITDIRINYVNASIIAEDRGITLKHMYNSESNSFTNLIRATVVTDNGRHEISGSLFSTEHMRLVNYNGYDIDVSPKGNMLFVKNKDIPGVVGKIGKVLGDKGVNIAEYILSRKSKDKKAFSIIKIDEKVDTKLIKKLKNIDEVLDLNPVNI